MILIPLEVRVVKREVDIINYEDLGLSRPVVDTEETWQLRHYSKTWLESDIASVHDDDGTTVIEFLDQTSITINEPLQDVLNKLI